MEILNNLWLAVSTPNETLMNIIAIPGTVIETLLTMLLFTSIFKYICYKKAKIIYVLSISCICLFMINYVEGPYKFIHKLYYCNCLLYMLFLKNLFLKQ